MTEKIIERKIMINAPVAEVWNAITDIKLMTQWMGEAALDQVGVSTCYDAG